MPPVDQQPQPGAPQSPPTAPSNQPQMQPNQVASSVPGNVSDTSEDSLQPQTTNTEKSKKSSKDTSQKSLLFSELRDNMIILNDGTFRAVVACQSINFDLMSSREREGIEYSYQNFLNALNFPVQILVRSQRVDIGPYIDKLDRIRRSQDNMLLNVLMDDYINFIGILAQEANIMDKSFFIVIPFSPEGDASQLVEKGKGFFNKIFGQQKPNVVKIDNVTYEKAKDEIRNRVDNTMSGLFQMGIHCAQLNTKQLGELYYNAYNPDTAVRQPLGDFEAATATFIKKGEGEAPRVNLSGEIE